MLRRLYPLGSPNHLLGTDELGRDMLSRLIYGGRLSLFMGVTPVRLRPADRRPARHHRGLRRRPRQHGDHAHHGRVLRLPVGAAGDLAVGRAWGRAPRTRCCRSTLVFIPPICRVSESVTTQVRGFDFVEAARASGAGALTIVRVHVLGNVLGPILVYATSLISVAIILAAGLSLPRASASSRPSRNGA